MSLYFTKGERERERAVVVTVALFLLKQSSGWIGSLPSPSLVPSSLALTRITHEGSFVVHTARSESHCASLYASFETNVHVITVHTQFLK